MGESKHVIYRSPLLDDLMNTTVRMYLSFNRGGRPMPRQGELIQKLPDAVENELIQKKEWELKEMFRTPESISGFSTDSIIEMLLRLNPNAEAYWNWERRTITIRTEEKLRLNDFILGLCRMVSQKEREFLKAYSVTGRRVIVVEIERK